MGKKIFTVEEVKRKLESYCVYQDRCHKEVEKKLNEFGMIPQAKEYILLHLLQEGFLNEERFAKSFARGKFRIKKWGKERIVRELKLRDITSANIKIALKEIEEEEYWNTATELVIKKNSEIKEENLFKRKNKIYQYLKYRGFENQMILELLEKLQ